MTNQAARQATQQYHADYYTQHELYSEGSWLDQPKAEAMAVVEKFLVGRKNLRVLDLGSGVGRNAIAIAQRIAQDGGQVTCVDYLPVAIEKLYKYAQDYGVAEATTGVVSPVEDFRIQANYYDFILAHSVLANVDTRANFDRTLADIIAGTKAGGFNYLNLITNLRETDVVTGQDLPAQVQVKLELNSTQQLLEDLYRDWTFHKLKARHYREDYVENGRDIIWQADYLLAVVEKETK